MNRKRIFVLAAVFALCAVTACGRMGKKEEDQQLQQEDQAQEMTGAENGAGTAADAGNAADGNGGENAASENGLTGQDMLTGGSAEELIYEVVYENRTYEAEDGAAIFEVKLAYPRLVGDGENETVINGYFDRWREEKIREYEEQEDSTWRSALEVYRESRDSGWMGPWSEEYAVSAVKAHGGYVSVLLDSYLYEGGNHGMPYRESFLFRKKDGERVELLSESGLTREEWGRLLEEKFAHMLEEAEESRYYSEAREILRTVDWEDVGSYFGDTGIVFYLPPYEIGPYSSGYAEVTVPYEEIFW